MAEPTPREGGPGPDLVELSLRLAELRDLGTLTEEEFQAARQRTLVAGEPADTG